MLEIQQSTNFWSNSSSKSEDRLKNFVKISILSSILKDLYQDLSVLRLTGESNINIIFSSLPVTD